jgi:hypothetical protein
MSFNHHTRQVGANALYVNIASASNLIYDATGARAAWATGTPALSNGITSAGALFRDMGKTLYLPAPTTASAVGAQSTILRKIQLVPSGANGYYGTGGASGTVGTEFLTGYIQIGGQTYAGGAGVGSGVGYTAAPTVFARAN